MLDDLRKNALQYHREPVPGKVEIAATKSLISQRDLALAYSPGVAFACEAIVESPNEARNLTVRGNLVAVVTNGTAVLGLGNIGPLAAKPVMEGKAVLFKKFAGINVFDLELAESDPDTLVYIIASLEPTFGGINLEDIKAPECFYIEKQLRSRMKIPVFHDDQHGTAIIVGAAVVNGLRVVGKEIGKVKLVVSGAGAAALACLDMLVALGVKMENIWVTDIKGVVYEGRKEEMDDNKVRYARKTEARKLADVIEGADIFLGLSAGGVLKQDMVKKMAKRPLILALANPNPEILPEDVKAVRDDAIIATGRSDYPNQVNNVLCFPFIFRGALDVGATTINEAMKLAAVNAIADLAHAEQSDIVAAAYGSERLMFGPEYLIPKPFDPRLITKLAPAVAKAAMESGVATAPIQDFRAYTDKLNEFVYQSGITMKPVFASAKAAPKRIVYTEGEDERVLRAAQVVIDEGIAKPILVGRSAVVERRIERFGLRLRPGKDFELVNPEGDPRYRDYWTEYHRMTERKGVSIQVAKLEMRRRLTLIGAMMVHKGEADGMLSGLIGAYNTHLLYVDQVLGKRPGVKNYYAMNLVMLPRRAVFLCDTYVNLDPTVEQLVEMTTLAAEEIRRFGMIPKVALVSHSTFGNSEAPTAAKMRAAVKILHEQMPDLEVEGEMQADAALNEDVRKRAFPNSKLKGEANLLVLPGLDAANISFNMLKIVGGAGITIGPMLLGCAKPVHIITPSATVRRIVNMTALTVADAQQEPTRAGSA
jgi:malate dehydrogenase (oxaloacetate-decarboxylating)(NADP+)